MRILLAHNNYKITGGAEVFYHEIGRILRKNGHQVAFFLQRKRIVTHLGQIISQKFLITRIVELFIKPNHLLQ